MKKFLIVAVLVSASFLGNAQVKFGAQLGGNISNVNYKDNSVGKYPTSSIFGFTIGGLAKISIAKSISFMPELNFTQKGAKIVEPATAYDYGYTTKTTLNYLEIPLNIAYDVNLGAGELTFTGGPSISIGLSGTVKSSYDLGLGIVTTDLYPTESYSVVFDGSNSTNDNNQHLKRLDLGFGLGASYKFGFGMFAGLGYNFGLSNISPYVGESIRNNGFKIKVGYMFGGK